MFKKFINNLCELPTEYKNNFLDNFELMGIPPKKLKKINLDISYFSGEHWGFWKVCKNYRTGDLTEKEARLKIYSLMKKLN